MILEFLNRWFPISRKEPIQQKELFIPERCPGYKEKRNSGCLNCTRFTQNGNKFCSIQLGECYDILKKEFQLFTDGNEDVLLDLLCQILEYPNMKTNGIANIYLCFEKSKGNVVFNKVQKNLPNFLSSELLYFVHRLYHHIQHKHEYEITSMYNHYHAVYANKTFKFYIEEMINEMKSKTIKMTYANQNFDLLCLFFNDRNNRLG